VLEHLHGGCLDPRVLSRVHEDHPQQQDLQVSSAQSPVCLLYPTYSTASLFHSVEGDGDCASSVQAGPHSPS
jgi:hypothetical protein